MEQNDFVLIVFQMLQGLKHWLVVFEAIEHIGENHHKAAAMRHFSNLVQALRR